MNNKLISGLLLLAGLYLTITQNKIQGIILVISLLVVIFIGVKLSPNKEHFNINQPIIDNPHSRPYFNGKACVRKNNDGSEPYAVNWWNYKTTCYSSDPRNVSGSRYNDGFLKCDDNIKCSYIEDCVSNKCVPSKNALRLLHAVNVPNYNLQKFTSSNGNDIKTVQGTLEQVANECNNTFECNGFVYNGNAGLLKTKIDNTQYNKDTLTYSLAKAKPNSLNLGEKCQEDNQCKNNGVCTNHYGSGWFKPNSLEREDINIKRCAMKCDSSKGEFLSNMNKDGKGTQFRCMNSGEICNNSGRIGCYQNDCVSCVCNDSKLTGPTGGYVCKPPEGWVKCQKVINKPVIPPFKEISGKHDKRINSIYFFDKNKSMTQSGKISSGSDFEFKCPDNLDIVAYKASDGNTESGESIFKGLGPVYCADGTVINTTVGETSDSLFGKINETKYTKYDYVAPHTITDENSLIGSIHGITDEQCVDLCDYYKGCSGFSYDNKTQKCALANVINTDVINNKSVGRTYKKRA